jgi:hypothetical protein
MGLLERLKELETMHQAGQINDSEYEMLVASAAKNFKPETESAPLEVSKSEDTTVVEENARQQVSSFKLTKNLDGLQKNVDKKKLTVISAVVAFVVIVFVLIATFSGNEKTKNMTSQLSSITGPLDGGVPISTEDWSNLTIRDLNNPRFENGETTNSFWAFEVSATYQGKTTGKLLEFVKGAVDQNGVLHRKTDTEENYEEDTFGGLLYSEEVVAGSSSKIIFWFDVPGKVTDLVFKVSDSSGEVWIKPAGSKEFSPPTTESAESKEFETRVVSGELKSITGYVVSAGENFNAARKSVPILLKQGRTQLAHAESRSALERFRSDLKEFCQKTIKTRDDSPSYIDESIVSDISSIIFWCNSPNDFENLLAVPDENFEEEWKRLFDGTTWLTFVDTLSSYWTKLGKLPETYAP